MHLRVHVLIESFEHLATGSAPFRCPMSESRAPWSIVRELWDAAAILSPVLTALSVLIDLTV